MLSQEALAPLPLLLFDPFATFKQRVLDTLRDETFTVRLQCVTTSSDFEAALVAAKWDAVLIAYTEESPKLAELVGQKAPAILICQNKEQADSAYTLTSPTINDVVLATQFKRLPFILRRELNRVVYHNGSRPQVETNAQSNTAASVLRSEARFRSVIEGFSDLILFVDHYQIVRYANADALSCELGFHVSDVIGKPLSEFLQSAEQAAIEGKLRTLLQTLDSQESFECQLRRADGDWETAEITGHSSNDPAGQATLILHVRIITEQKLAAEKISNLNRTLGVITDINQAIIRIRDTAVLFKEVCKIAVEKGAFRLAWIGLLDSKTRRVEPVGYAGIPAEHVNKLAISLDDEVLGPAGLALQERRHILVNDTQTDPIMQPWRANTARLGHGSVAALPLQVSGEIRGVLYLYTEETQFFNDAETHLVLEMAEDIAFALEFAEQETRAKQAQIDLLTAESRYHRMLDDLLEGAEILDFNWHYLYVNDASASHGRMSKEVLLNSTVLALYPGIEQSELFGYLRICMEERTPQHFENEFVFPDGATTWFELRVQPIPEGIFILSLDITERKHGEIALTRYAKRMEILHEIDTKLIQGGSVQALIQTTLIHLRQLIPCQQANVTLVDQFTGEGVIYAHDLHDDSFFTEGVRFNLPDDVFEGYDASGIRLFNDIRPLEASSSRVKQLLSEGMISLLSAMLTDQDNPVGSLVLVSDTPNYFTPEHREITSQVAKQLAIAVRQLRLSEEIAQHTADLEQNNADLTQAKIELQRYAHRMEILREIDIGIINATSTEELVNTALKHIRQLIPCQRVSVVLFDWSVNEWLIYADDAVRPYALEKAMRRPIPVNWDAGFGGEPTRLMEDIRVVQPQIPVYAQLATEGLISGIQALLMVQGHPIGLLGLNADRTDFFTTEHKQIATEIAGQIGIALRQMQLSEVLTHHAAEMEQKNTDLTQAETQLQRYARRMEILHEIDSGIINATSTELLVETALRQIRQIIPCQRITLTLVNEALQQGLIYATNLDDQSILTKGTHLSLPAEGNERFRQSHIVNDVRESVRLHPNPVYQVIMDEGMRSALHLPLISQGNWMGVLTLTADRVGVFTPEHQEIAEQIANQLAVAIRQKQLSEELHESETRYRRVVQDQTELICRYKADFTVTFANQAYASFIGKQAEDLVGYNFFGLMPEEDQSLFKTNLAKLNASNSVMTSEYRSVRPDGREYWVQWTDRALLDEVGNITEYQAVGRDITKRKEAEELLRKSEARQRAMLAAIPDMMFRYQADGTFLEYHAPDSDLLATLPEEFLGKKAGDVLPAELANRLYKQIEHVVATKEPILSEYELDVQSGTREFESRLVPVGDDEVLAIVRDVTERKLAERELQSLYNATSHLFKADSLLSLGRQIAATVIREFEHVDCGILLLDKSKNNILRLARTGQSDLRPDIPLQLNGPGLVPLALRTGDMVYVPDVTQNKNYIASESSTLSEFVIPLKTANGIIGALDMQKAQKNAFSDRDRRILVAYAERAAPAIEIMQLYEELNRHAADLEWRVAQRTVELNYAKERAEAILNHSTDGIILLDSNMVIEQTNLAFNEIFAAQDDAYFEQSFTELLEPEERDRIEQIFQAGMLDKKSQHLETRARRQNGTSFDAELSIGFIKKSGLVCIIRDITERKQSEKAIAEERNLLRTLIDALPDYIYVKDTHHKIMLSNLARTQSLGLAPDALIGKDDYDYLPAELSNQYHADEDRLFQTLEPLIDREERSIGDEGAVIWASTTKVPLHNLNGELIGLVGVTRDISERKLREQQLRFDAGIQSSLSDAVIATDLEFRIQSWNKAAENIYGWMVNEVLGKTIADVLRTRFESGQARSDSREDLFARGQLQDEFIQERKDGTELHIQSSSTVYHDETGTPIGIVGVNRDITERKKAEQALRESETRLSVLINGIRDYAISLLDTQGNIVTWSQGAERIEGYTEQEITGKNISRFYTPEGIERGEPQRILEMAKKAGHHSLEGERVRKDGSRFWAEVSITALKDNYGHVFGYTKVTVDLTERRKAQETLRLSEERYRLLAENITDIISRITPEGVYVDVSSSSKTVLGYAPDEMIDKLVTDFTHPDDKASVLQKEQDLLPQRNEFPLTYRFRHRDGHYIWLEVARKPIMSMETYIIQEYVTSSRDITVRKRAEEALKNALEKEKELGELKSRFVSMASHEFRTPLATILASSETLSAYRQKLSENQIQDKLNKIGEQVAYLKSIIEDTLQVARLQDPKAKFEPVSLDLITTCQSVIDEFKTRSEVTQEFVFTHDDKLQEAQLDRKLIRQIINNLLSNAVKYSAPDTTIKVALERIDEVLMLKVQDEGIGISEADLKHLFEPFHRGANVGTISGTGLGLVIAKESVELHAGFMTVDSKVGVGTTFTIMIPLQ